MLEAQPEPAAHRPVVSGLGIEVDAGGLLGVGLGIGLSFFITHFFSQHTIVTTWSPMLALTISVAVGVLFGTYPARRAAFLDPIEALRHE